MLLATLAALSAPVAPGAPQDWEITPLVLEGDSVTGVGLVTRIDNIAVNDALGWLVEADTDNGDTDADSVLLSPAGLYLQEGQSLATPAGAFLDSFDAVNQNTGGNSAWNLFLDGTAGTTDDSGLYFNTNLLMQEGTDYGIAGLSAGSAWRGFFEAKINELDQIVVHGTVDDPAIESTVDQVFAAVSVDGSGNFVAAGKLWAEADILPGQTEGVATFGSGPHNWDFNDAGNLMFYADLAGDTAVDTVIYLDGVLLAQEGSPSPVVGRDWASLATPEMSINASAQYVHSGSLTGDSASNLVIIKDGALFRQEGDTLPGLAGFTITSFGSGPIDIADNGDVLWYGDWNDPDTDIDTGLFLNDELIVQEGVTTVGGVVIDTLRGVQEGYFISPDGRFIVFEAILLDGTEGAFLMTRKGTVVSHPGCFANAGTLGLEGTSPGIGDTLNFQLDNAQAPSATALAFSLTPIAGFPPCGIPVPGIGEVLIDITPPNPFLILNGLPWGGAPVSILLGMPDDPALIGATLWAQGLFVDLFAGPEPLRLTNMLQVTLGS